MNDICEAEVLPEPISYVDAVVKVMGFTKETNKEAGFIFIFEEQKTGREHIDKIFYGDCKKVYMDDIKGDNNANFHTHPKQDYCHPSPRDIVLYTGHRLVIGCPHKRFKNTFSTNDLRFINDENIKSYTDAIEFECKEIYKD
ncbi:hypothetical protein LCGC14_0223970 [marine sediment metagenome]|uniref:Uncharacterized protein n=1 Tax=marine sediment metagenome TaxID=412755 RepID=A0A0F9UGN9_9ZZZZ